jgi:hypothetical protein
MVANNELVTPAQADILFKSSSRQQRLKIDFFSTFILSTSKR